jgi:hypothetical protein
MKRLFAAGVLAMASGTSLAGNVDISGLVSQSDFKDFSKDLVAAFSYKAGSPAESLGLVGFDVGLATSSTKLEHTDIWDQVLSGSKINNLVIPKVYLQKGLPLDIDVGVYYFAIPDSNLDAWGAEVKYSVIGGNVALPAVAVRGATTRLSAADQLEVTTTSLDVSISKSILMVTPYAGIGRVWADSTPKGTAAGVLKAESLSATKSFIGVSLTPGIFDLSLEGDSVGGVKSYNLKLGLAF